MRQQTSDCNECVVYRLRTPAKGFPSADEWHLEVWKSKSPQATGWNGSWKQPLGYVSSAQAAAHVDRPDDLVIKVTVAEPHARRHGAVRQCPTLSPAGRCSLYHDIRSGVRRREAPFITRRLRCWSSCFRCQVRAIRLQPGAHVGVQVSASVFEADHTQRCAIGCKSIGMNDGRGLGRVFSNVQHYTSAWGLSWRMHLIQINHETNEPADNHEMSKHLDGTSVYCRADMQKPRQHCTELT